MAIILRLPLWDWVGAGSNFSIGLFWEPLSFPWWVLLGILGGGVPPSSPNPDHISDQKIYFSLAFSDLASKIHTLFQN